LEVLKLHDIFFSFLSVLCEFKDISVLVLCLLAFHKFDSVDAYDLADVLKRYFREVPNSLLTPQATQLLMTIFTGSLPKLQSLCM